MQVGGHLLRARAERRYVLLLAPGPETGPTASRRWTACSPAGARRRGARLPALRAPRTGRGTAAGFGRKPAGHPRPRRRGLGLTRRPLVQPPASGSAGDSRVAGSRNPAVRPSGRSSDAGVPARRRTHRLVGGRARRGTATREKEDGVPSRRRIERQRGAVVEQPAVEPRDRLLHDGSVRVSPRRPAAGGARPPAAGPAWRSPSRPTPLMPEASRGAAGFAPESPRSTAAAVDERSLQRRKRLTASSRVATAVA